MMQEAQIYKDTWQAAQRARLEEGRDEDSFVYLHLNSDDDLPHHVGMGYVATRPWQMNRSNKHRSKVAKHGVRVEIIADELTFKTALWWEVRWIKALRAAGYELTNLTDGGDGANGFVWTEELKQRHKQRLNSSETKTKRKITNESPELIAIRQKNTANSWKVDSVRERRCLGIKKTLNSPASKEKRAKANSLPEVKVRRSEVSKEVQNRPEVKAAKRARAIAQWECPEKKQNHKRAMENPEVGKKISAKKKGVLRTDAQKSNISAGQQAFQNSRTPEEKAASYAKANETKRKNGTLRPNRTLEENQAASRKAWETRRRNKLLKEGVE